MEAALLLDPQVFLPSATRIDAIFRRRYIALDASLSTHHTLVANKTVDDAHATWVRWGGQLVMQSARFLEFLVVAAATWELLTEADETSIEAYGFARARAEVIARCGIDPVDASEAVADLGDVSSVPDVDQRFPSRSVVVRSIRAILESYPQRDLAEAAVESGKMGWKRRADNAARHLRLFLLRHDAEMHQRADMLGEMYQIGRMDIPEIAALLHESVGDTVALLEQRGFARDLGQTIFTQRDRSARLRSIRLDREVREALPGRSDFSRYVDRAVIASERIEGVDARTWLIQDPANRPE